MSEPVKVIDTGEERQMRFAYADPPWIKIVRFTRDLAKQYDHPELHVYHTIEGHKALIERLCSEFPDGWAYSLQSSALRLILPLCPDDCRVSAWTKTFATFRPGVKVAYAWEPVIWRGGRKRESPRPTVRDWVSCSAIPGHGNKFFGAKPESFCWWLFEMLGMEPEDEFVDLFTGSGAVGRAWEIWKQSHMPLFPDPSNIPCPIPTDHLADAEPPLFGGLAR